MDKEIHNNKCQYPETLDELIDVIEKNSDEYKHLQIFFSRECPNGSPTLGEEYLAITTAGFALYRLDDINYQNGIINISLTEKTTSEAETYTLDINDKNPKCIFIRWNDIRKMVLDGCFPRAGDE